MKRALFVIITGCALVLGSTLQAHAAPILSITNTTGLGLGNPPFTLGFEFTAINGGQITALGFFDDSQNGLADAHALGLWNSAGTLLASTTIPSGTGSVLIDKFRYVSIAPVNLIAGQNYRIGALYLTGNDPLIFPGDATGFLTDPNITFIGSRFAGGGVLTDPGASVSNEPSYFGPNALFSIPEPASLTLFGLIVGAAGVYGWRRRGQSKA